jgi:hypothetical protein
VLFLLTFDWFESFHVSFREKQNQLNFLIRTQKISLGDFFDEKMKQNFACQSALVYPRSLNWIKLSRQILLTRNITKGFMSSKCNNNSGVMKPFEILKYH